MAQYRGAAVYLTASPVTDGRFDLRFETPLALLSDSTRGLRSVQPALGMGGAKSVRCKPTVSRHPHHPAHHLELECVLGNQQDDSYP